MDQAEKEATIPRKLLCFAEKKKRYKIAIGGRGGAKSQTIADLCILDVANGMKVGCFREFQNSIDDSVYSLLKHEIERLDYDQMEVQATSIRSFMGGEFRFRGLARNPQGVKSMHGFKRFWIEEAQTISEESLRLLTPTLREEDSEIWMSANPMSSADPFSQRFIVPFQAELDRDGYYEDDMHLIVVINYYDNHWFPEELEQERRFDKAHLSEAEYQHIWLGKFNDTVEGAIIPVRWFNAAIDAHRVLGFEPRGAIVVAHDPSDEGRDPKGLCVRHGSVIVDVREKTDGDANDGMDWALQAALDWRADVFRWDCDGLGVSLKRQVSSFLDQKGIDIDMFKGSESPEDLDAIYQPERNIDKANAKTNKQTFRNRRAQMYWRLRDRFRATYEAVTKGTYLNPEELISISSDISCMDRFRSEVCRIPRKPNANGLIQIMSKEDMAKLKPPIASPNLADSAMMTMPVHSRAYRAQTTVRQVRTKAAAGWT